MCNQQTLEKLQWQTWRLCFHSQSEQWVDVGSSGKTGSEDKGGNCLRAEVTAEMCAAHLWDRQQATESLGSKAG